MGAPSLSDYRRIVGDEPIDELERLASGLRGSRVQHVNSTRVGGGVAEILQRMVPLMREVGLEAFWDVIEGDEAFFRVTKAFHNALQGLAQDLDEGDFEVYCAANRRNAERLAFRGDFVFVHDPQPAALVEFARREVSDPILVWRCHIDASAPDPRVWEFLTPYVAKYHAAVISAPAFA
ncbi:MAG: glycosyl transferase family 1, partial [Planctomycetota bacterium]